MELAPLEFDKPSVKAGERCSHYLLVLTAKSVVFNPTNNSYHILVEESHERLVRLLSKTEQSMDKIVDELRLHFQPFKDAKSAYVSYANAIEHSGAELISFSDRFRKFLDIGKVKAFNKFKLSLFILALVGSSWGCVLLAMNKFHVLIQGSNKKRNKAPESFSYAVGYNTLLATRMLPIALDCKVLAYTYKFIYGVYGYQCEIAIGVLEDPFVAHMWAVSDGVPHGELPEVANEVQKVYCSSWVS